MTDPHRVGPPRRRPAPLVVQVVLADGQRAEPDPHAKLAAVDHREIAHHLAVVVLAQERHVPVLKSTALFTQALNY